MTDVQDVEFDVPAKAPPQIPPPNGHASTSVAVRPDPTPPIAQSGTAHVMSMIERLTLDTTITIERAEQAFAFYQKVQAEQAKKEFVAAFAACQSEMGPVAKDANNPQTRSKYASLAALDRAIRPIYTAHGFSVSFDAAESPLADHVRVLCFLAHRGGHERTYHIDMACDGKGAKGGDVMTKTHAMGSAFSYGKRYLLGNVFNISSAETDDEGNAAGRPAPQRISAAQVAELESIAKNVGADIGRFCAYCKVATLSDIAAANFAAARAALLMKKNGRAS